MAKDSLSVWSNQEQKLAGITVDLIISEDHTLSSNPTNIALEEGAIVTDHVILQPTTVTVTFQMENYDGENEPAAGENAKTAFASFSKLQQTRELVELVTAHAVYKDMLLSELTGQNTAPVNGRLQGTAKFVQISKVKLEKTSIPAGSTKKRYSKTATTNVTGGTQTATAPTKKQSTLYMFAKG